MTAKRTPLKGAHSAEGDRLFTLYEEQLEGEVTVARWKVNEEKVSPLQLTQMLVQVIKEIEPMAKKEHSVKERNRILVAPANVRIPDLN